jgi:predicted metal-dependent hydrolase
MRAHLRAGVAVYDEGRYHAAHDAWEEYWLDLESGTDDERLLHGLIQFTAVVHHARERNWSGAVGLAESAGEYLADLPAGYRGIALDPVRQFLARMAADPEHLERVGPPSLTHEGESLGYDDLDFEATTVVATVLTEADGYDEAAMERAIEYAREEVDAGTSGTYTGLVFSFVRDPAKRGIVFQRLAEHIQRERSREADVEGLFD